MIFGKKTQLSGIAVQDKFSKIFKSPLRLEVTWDADIIDMIRCNYIMKVFEEESLLENVNNKSEIFLKNLKNINFLRNVRNSGLLFAFDFDTKN